MDIACALRWGVAFVEDFLARRISPFMGQPFQVQGRHQWTALRRGRDWEKGGHVALVNLFVKRKVLGTN